MYNIIIFLFLGLIGCTPNALTEEGEGDMKDSDMKSLAMNDMSEDEKIQVPDASKGKSGETLYGEFCAGCHGKIGEGNAVWEGSIQGFEPILDIVKEGKGTMGMIVMEDADIEKVQAFLLTQVPSTIDGKFVYAQKCAGCHGKEGKGVKDRGFQLRYKDAGYSTHITRNGRDIYNFKYSRKGMPAYDTTVVSDTHLVEIWAWLDSLPNETTEEGLYVQFCANCHNLSGKSSVIEKSITGKSDSMSDIRGGHSAGQYEARTKYMTKWTAEQLSDGEIVKINTFVSGLE